MTDTAGPIVAADGTPSFIVQSISPVPDANPTQLRRDVENIVFAELERRTGSTHWMVEAIHVS